MKQSPFDKEANLMVQMIPEVAKENCFALKGGTAINFFWREMPRLSVDLDLTYLPIEDRNTSLVNISAALDRIATSIEKVQPNLKVQRARAKGSQRISKLVVIDRDAQIKIEPNEVIRGFVFPVQERELCSRAELLFEKTASITTLSFADLYGGKLCAALDRQHPRDIYDIKVLLENEGITDEIRKAFLIYLSSHDRPINEVIQPNRKDIKQSFEREFVGMVDAELTLDELVQVREKYIEMVSNSLSNEERKFLISLKQGEPEWKLLGIANLDSLPAIQWKLRNIQLLKERNKAKHEKSLNKLKRKLGF